jgi:hypothetical protein
MFCPASGTRSRPTRRAGDENRRGVRALSWRSFPTCVSWQGTCVGGKRLFRGGRHESVYMHARCDPRDGVAIGRGRRARPHLRRRDERWQSARDDARHARLSLHRVVPDHRHARRPAGEQRLGRLPGPGGLRARHHGDASRWGGVLPLRVRRRGPLRPVFPGLAQCPAGESGRAAGRRGLSSARPTGSATSRTSPTSRCPARGATSRRCPSPGSCPRPRPARLRWTTSGSAKAPRPWPNPVRWRSSPSPRSELAARS